MKRSHARGRKRSQQRDADQLARRIEAAEYHLEKTKRKKPLDPAAVEEAAAELDQLRASAEGAFSSTIRARMLADLKRSGLTELDTQKLGLKPLTGAEAKLAGFQDRPCYLIPYWGMDGKRLASGFDRCRYLDDADGVDSKHRRYGQVKESTCRLYFPPIFPWKKVLVPGAVVYLTEGEKKALTACKLGIPCVAIGGVDNWRQKKKGFNIAVPDFFELMGAIEGGELRVVYDSDLPNKPEVRAALASVSHVALKRGVTPQTVLLPGKDDLKIKYDPSIDPLGKVGLDDYLVARSRKDFEALPLESSELLLKLQLFNGEYCYIRELDRFWSFTLRKFLSEDHLRRDTADRTVILANPKGQAEVPVFELWLKWKDRATYRGVAFEPGAPQRYINGSDDPLLNTWHSQLTEVKAPRATLNIYFEVLNKIFPPDNPEAVAARKWFEQWAAYPLVYPGAKLHQMVVLISKAEGTAKSMLGDLIMSAYGAYGAEIRGDRLTARFNSAFQETLFLLVNEIYVPERHDIDGIMKSLVTDNTLTIERKGVDTFIIKNRMNILGTSNHPNALLVSRDSRRYFIWRVDDERIADTHGEGFIRRVRTWLGKETDSNPKSPYFGKAGQHLLEYFRHGVSLEGFKPWKEAPITRAMTDMAELNQGDVDTWLVELLRDPDPKLFDLLTTSQLVNNYNTFHQKHASFRTMGLALHGMHVPRRHTEGGHFWIIRNRDFWLSKPGPALIKAHLEKSGKPHLARVLEPNKEVEKPEKHS